MKTQILFLMLFVYTYLGNAYGKTIQQTTEEQEPVQNTEQMEKEDEKIAREKLKMERNRIKAQAKAEKKDQNIASKKQQIEENKLNAHLAAQKKEETRLNNIRKQEKLLSKLQNKLMKKRSKLNNSKTSLEQNKISGNMSEQDVNKEKVKILGLESNIKDLELLIEKESKTLETLNQ